MSEGDGRKYTTKYVVGVGGPDKAVPLLQQ